ncbi:hypothetical protein GL267_008725 [Acidithiobacillus ferrianus]|uniref:Uncharacterized protein n=2 Tax=Acidithiobacillus ferrianus TaxID=2678518 RepID=A0A845U7R2_9PROT|nr:hypothetical protein [Acidithiobacillus ferrianus]NDU43476.1 hypothetical protein [Acidithiobacillus ferrianus]
METKMLFEIMRFNVLSAARSKDQSCMLNNATVFAWAKRIFPLYHNEDSFHVPFASLFRVSEEMIDDLSETLDKNKMTFYQLEDYFDVRGIAGHSDAKTSGWDRPKLIYSCRYLKLCGLYDDELWNTLMKPMEHPSESTSVMKPFDRENDLCL